MTVRALLIGARSVKPSRHEQAGYMAATCPCIDARSLANGEETIYGLSGPGRHHHCTASRIRSTKHQENHFLAGIKKAAWGEAAWGSFKCLKEGGMRVA